MINAVYEVIESEDEFDSTVIHCKVDGHKTK